MEANDPASAHPAPRGDDQERPEPSLHRGKDRGRSGGGAFWLRFTHAVLERPDDVDEQQARLRAVHAKGPDAVLMRERTAIRRNGTLWAMHKDGINILRFASRPDAFEPHQRASAQPQRIARLWGS